MADRTGASEHASGNHAEGQQEHRMPARAATSSFGNDAELASELPPGWTLARFQQEVKRVLDEYFVSLAVDDTVSQVRELLTRCPSEVDELGVLAMRASLDRDEGARRAAVALLKGLFESSDFDKHALVRSFEKLFCTWEDIVIDVPKAPEALLDILHSCITEDIVDRSLLTKLPESLLNAGMSKASPDFAGVLSTVSHELKDFKKQATVCLDDYFASVNIDEVTAQRTCRSQVATFLSGLDMRAYHHEFVKKAIVMSFSQPGEESSREAVLLLFTHLNAEGILGKDDLQWGITRLLGQLDDLKLDCPRVEELTTEFLVSLISDNLVSVPFLRRCRLLRIGGSTGLRVLEETQRRTPEYSKRLLDPAHFKQVIHGMITEYFSSGNANEFSRSVRDLAPLDQAQSSELIRKVMTYAMERSGEECQMALELLVTLCRQEELSEEALEGGFDEIFARLPDIQLDVPDAREMADTFVEKAKRAGVLRHDWPTIVES